MRGGSDDLTLTAPACGALGGARLTFVLFFFLQALQLRDHWSHGASSHCADCRMRPGSSTRTSTATAWSQSINPLTRSLQTTLVDGDLSAVVRAPMPSQQRMTDYFLAKQIKTFHTTGRFHRMLRLLVPWPCLLLLICLVCTVTFVSSSGFQDRQLGAYFYMTVVGVPHVLSAPAHRSVLVWRHSG